MGKVLKYITGLLGLWLIVEISVFPAVAALWIAFATAIAVALVAVVEFGVGVARRDPVSASTATLTALLAAFLIVASLVFDGASTSWLMATAGGVIELLALGALGFAPSRAIAEVVTSEARPEPREEARRAA